MKHFMITLDYKSLSDVKDVDRRVNLYEDDVINYLHKHFVCSVDVTYNVRTKYHRIKVDFRRYVPALTLSYLPFKMYRILLHNKLPNTVIKSIKFF